MLDGESKEREKIERHKEAVENKIKEQKQSKVDETERDL